VQSGTHTTEAGGMTTRDTSTVVEEGVGVHLRTRVSWNLRHDEHLTDDDVQLAGSDAGLRLHMNEIGTNRGHDMGMTTVCIPSSYFAVAYKCSRFRRTLSLLWVQIAWSWPIPIVICEPTCTPGPSFFRLSSIIETIRRLVPLLLSSTSHRGG
jgi:hypothetical protein